MTFTDELRAYLADKGFDPLMGARPMQRLIQDVIRRALADELLFGKLANGGAVRVDIKDEQVSLFFEEPGSKADDHEHKEEVLVS